MHPAESSSTLALNGAAPARGATRVAVLFHRFGPYHHARLNAAGRLMAVWGVEACSKESIYRWDKVEGAAAFTRLTLTDSDSGDRRWRQEVRRKMFKTLAEIKPQAVVIPGWTSVDALAALWWCRANAVPAVVMSESTVWDDRRRVWKEWIKSRLVRLCSAGLVGGTPHAEYLRQLGQPKERIFLGYDVVDNDYFAAAAMESRRGQPDDGQPGGARGYFLASARFVEKKNLFRLIDAYARYCELSRGTDTRDLVILGDGPLGDGLRARLAALGLGARVLLPGFKQYDELPKWYAGAAAFIHASTTEQWGLVVNEAMASGLPVLVSNRCGCARDLVKEGLNGFTFAPHDVEGLAALMKRMATLGPGLAAWGAASQEIISLWGPERFAESLKLAVEVALQRPPPPAGFMDRLLLKLLLLQ